MEDAVSVNTYLKPTHFEDHHVYRVEWQPGATGHLEWYVRNIYSVLYIGYDMHNLFIIYVRDMRIGIWTVPLFSASPASPCRS